MESFALLILNKFYLINALRRYWYLFVGVKSLEPELNVQTKLIDIPSNLFLEVF